VSIEADIITCSYSPAQGSPPLIDVMSDLYNFPQNAAILNQDFNLTAKIVSGLIYLGECAAVIDVNTYSNVFFYLDRDTTNNAPAIVFHGREATGAGIYCSRPNQSVAVFDIPFFSGGPSFSIGPGPYPSLAHCVSGELVFNSIIFLQNPNPDSTLFKVSSDVVNFALIDPVHAGRLYFNHCSVLGRNGNTNQLVAWSNGGTVKNPTIFVLGQLAYCNASTTTLPANDGPGTIVNVPTLTNHFFFKP
jgi:hypothetical protein